MSTINDTLHDTIHEIHDIAQPVTDRAVGGFNEVTRKLLDHVPSTSRSRSHRRRWVVGGLTVLVIAAAIVVWRARARSSDSIQSRDDWAAARGRSDRDVA